MGLRPKYTEHSALHIPLICIGATQATYEAAQQIYMKHPSIGQEETEYFSASQWMIEPSFKTYSAYASGLSNKTFETQATYSQALSHFSSKKIT